MEGQTEVSHVYDRATGDHNQSLGKIVNQNDQNNNLGNSEQLAQESEGSYSNITNINANNNNINNNNKFKENAIARRFEQHQGNFSTNISDSYTNMTYANTSNYFQPMPPPYYPGGPNQYPPSFMIPAGDFHDSSYPNPGNHGNQHYPNNQLQTNQTVNYNQNYLLKSESAMAVKNKTDRIDNASNNTQDDYKVIHIDFQPVPGNHPINIPIHSIYDFFNKETSAGKNTVLRIIKYKPNKKRDPKSSKDPHHALIEFEKPINARTAVEAYSGKFFTDDDQIHTDNRVSMRIEKSNHEKLAFNITGMGKRQEENCWDYEQRPRPDKMVESHNGKLKRNFNNPCQAQETRELPDHLSGQNHYLYPPANFYQQYYGGCIPVVPHMPFPTNGWPISGHTGYPINYSNYGHYRGYLNSRDPNLNNENKVIEVGPLNVDHPRFKDHIKDDLFKLFGHYGDIRLLKLEYKRSLEWALIEYVHERNGAENAISCLQKVKFYGNELEVKKSKFKEVNTNHQARDPGYNSSNDVKEKVRNGDLSKSYKEGHDVHRYKNEKSFNHRNDNERTTRLDVTTNHAHQKIRPNKIMHISNIPEDFTKEELFCQSVHHNDDLLTFDKEGAKQLKFFYEKYCIIDETHTFDKNFKWQKDGSGGLGQTINTTRPDDQKEKKKLKMAYINLKTIEDAVMFLCLTHNFQVREKRHLRVSFSKKSDWEKIPEG